MWSLEYGHNGFKSLAFLKMVADELIYLACVSRVEYVLKIADLDIVLWWPVSDILSKVKNMH